MGKLVSSKAEMLLSPAWPRMAPDRALPGAPAQHMEEPSECHAASSVLALRLLESSRRRRKAAAALGSHGTLQQVWTLGSRDCSQTTALLLQLLCAPPSTASLCHAATTANATVPGTFTLFPTHPCPTHGSEAPSSPSQVRSLPALQCDFNCSHHTRLPLPHPSGPSGSDGPGISHLEGL